MRKNILWLNRLFLLFLSEKDEQKRADEQHIRIEQLRHDFKCVDGFAQTGCGGDGNEHLCAVGQDALEYAGEGIQNGGSLSAADAVVLGHFLCDGVAITMATVLFAVAISISPTNKPMPSRPPLLPLKTCLIQCRRAAKPPYSLMSAQIAATRIATMLVSNIPAAPVPILPSKSVGAIMLVAIMITEPLMTPIISTRNTFSPTMPPISTRI